ncbi:MAG: hypothetical protein QOE90_965 [Thermoplasmata archaeon]|jgi:hypothetical protein|nr:hypothetical protein [Thermoplasmata archaeon]
MFVLLDATSPEATPYASFISAVAALLATVFAVVAFRALARTGNPALRWVGIAFVLMALKEVFAAYNVVTHFVPHDAIELVLASCDLVIMGLLFTPLFRRRSRS